MMCTEIISPSQVDTRLLYAQAERASTEADGDEVELG
jgi:hypothetical protein